MVQRLLEAIHCHLFYDNFKPVLKQCTARALKTDMCILTGHRTHTPYAEYWTQTYRANNFMTVRENGDLGVYSPRVKNPAIRPIEYPNFLPKEVLEKCVHTEIINGCEVKIVRYGAFPQSVANRKISAELEEAYKSKKIKKTGKGYSFNMQNGEFIEPEAKLVLKRFSEYQWGEHYYIRFIARQSANARLTAGQKVEYGKPYWVRVEAIDWLLNETNGTPDMMIARYALSSGIAIDNKDTYDARVHTNWQKTQMCAYLSSQFEREIKQHDVLKENIVRNKAINRLCVRREREVKYDLPSFLNFAVKRIGHEVFFMQRVKYFQKLVALKKEFLNLNGNDMFPRHINIIDNYIRGHIYSVMQVKDMTPAQALQEICYDILEKYGLRMFFTSQPSTMRRVQNGYANPLINPLALINNNQKERE